MTTRTTSQACPTAPPGEAPLAWDGSLRWHREARGWTQESLGRHSGLDRQLIGRLERGAVQRWRPEWMTSLAQALDVDVAVLFPPRPSLVPPRRGRRTSTARAARQIVLPQDQGLASTA